VVLAVEGAPLLTVVRSVPSGFGVSSEHDRVTAFNQEPGHQFGCVPSQPIRRGSNAIVQLPLSSLTATHPQVCGIFRKRPGEVSGTPVRESCERGAEPQCRFTVALPPK
jgi:hypothetical protein